MHKEPNLFPVKTIEIGMERGGDLFKAKAANNGMEWVLLLRHWISQKARAVLTVTRSWITGWRNLRDFQPLALSNVGQDANATLLPFCSNMRRTVFQLEFVPLSHTRATASPCLKCLKPRR
jgi:hypothetical protein